MPDGADAGAFRANVAEAALAGLLAEPKTLPSKLFYDARGCALFDQITELPEYYVTRVELALLARVAPELRDLTAPRTALVEYGAGTETKAAIVLAALDAPAAYVPIDVAGEAIAHAAARLRPSFPGLRIVPMEADFLAPLRLPGGLAPVLGFFPGSTIGNLEPEVAIRFLRQARDTLGPDARFLIGADLRKSPDLLIPAYDDAAGVTAAFNLNMLVRLNREAAADFDLSAFAHRAIWNEPEGRVEMHLESLRPQTVGVAGRRLDFARGETIHTENSYKHTREGLIALARAAGWTAQRFWTDPRQMFGIHLFT